MPYRLAKDVTLTADGKAGSKLFPKDTLFERTATDVHLDDQKKKVVEITVTKAGTRYTGIVEVRLLRPVYGQTAKLNGLLIVGTDQVRALCAEFSQALLKLPWSSYAANTKRSFMIGVLTGVDLDDKPVSYAALSANQYGAPKGWGEVAKKLGFTPAPDLPKFQGHGGGRSTVQLKNLSGKRIKPIKAGKRVSERAGRNAHTTDWDVEDGANPAIDREGNEPGSCAAPKMLQLAMRSGVTPRAMWEQWFDQRGGITHEVPMESCATCKVNITRMLKR